MAPEVKFDDRLASDPIYFIEHCLKVIDKKEQLTPMQLWPAQKHFIEHQGKRNVILKNRQQGMSTGIMANSSHALFTKQYQRMCLIAHEDSTAEFLFQTVQRFYKNLPWNEGIMDADKLRPRTDWKSGRRMRFPSLDSYIYIDSARSDNLSVGFSLSRAHLSEMAKWPAYKADQLFADVSQTVSADGSIIIESTPKGKQGLFYKLYQSAKLKENDYSVFFYPWWWDVTCIADTETWLTKEKADIIARKLGITVQTLTNQERLMSEEYKLSPSQVAFRRQKIGELDARFFQEYPENDIDCWLAAEMSVIDGSILRDYYLNIKPGRTEGNLTIWKDVVGGEDYVIGVDVAAGSARDYSVASVLRVRNMEYVARIRGKIHPDMFGEQLAELGKRYNNALLAVEKANHGHWVLKILLDKDYPNLYYHTDYDEDTPHLDTNYVGWITTSKTKPMMVSGLIAAMRSGDLISYSDNLVDEISSIVWKTGASDRIETLGSNDDEFIAVSIALQVRDSVPILSGKSGYSIGHYATAF